MGYKNASKRVGPCKCQRNGVLKWWRASSDLQRDWRWALGNWRPTTGRRVGSGPEWPAPGQTSSRRAVASPGNAEAVGSSLSSSRSAVSWRSSTSRRPAGGRTRRIGSGMHRTGWPIPNPIRGSNEVSGFATLAQCERTPNGSEKVSLAKRKEKKKKQLPLLANSYTNRSKPSTLKHIRQYIVWVRLALKYSYRILIGPTPRATVSISLLKPKESIRRGRS